MEQGKSQTLCDRLKPVRSFFPKRMKCLHVVTLIAGLFVTPPMYFLHTKMDTAGIERTRRSLRGVLCVDGEISKNEEDLKYAERHIDYHNNGYILATQISLKDQLKTLCNDGGEKAGDHTKSNGFVFSTPGKNTKVLAAK